MSQHLGADRTTAGGHAKFAPGPAVPAPSCPSNEALYLDCVMCLEVVTDPGFF